MACFIDFTGSKRLCQSVPERRYTIFVSIRRMNDKTFLKYLRIV